MSKFYRHKESGLIVRPVGAGEEYVDVVLACEMEARLVMTSAEFDEKFKPCKTHEVDLFHTVLGPSELDLYFMEYVPVGFSGPDRRRKIVVSYNEIIEAFLLRAVVLHEDIQPKE